MKILQVLPSRQGSRLWLQLDNGQLLPLSPDDYFRLKLQKSVEISPDVITAIYQQSARTLLLAYSLRQIAISPKSRLELLRKLKLYFQKIQLKYHYQPEIMESSIQFIEHYLDERNLISDESYREYLLRKYKNKSQNQLNLLLSQKGLSAPVIVPPSEEIDKIKNLIRKRYSSVNLQDYHSKVGLISKLFRRGFSVNYIKTAIDELLDSG